MRSLNRQDKKRGEENGENEIGSSCFQKWRPIEDGLPSVYYPADPDSSLFFLERKSVKILGIVLTVLGGLMVLSGINLMLTQYDMTQSHDISKAMGGMGISVVILVVGLSLIGKSKNRKK